MITTRLNIDILPPGRLPDLGGAFLVGGSVRDMLLGRPPEDYDIAVLTNPENYAAEMARRLGCRPIRIGKPGKWVYRLVAKESTFDITPVNGPTIESDLLRRDFTINAIALCLATGELTDCAGGVEDLKKKRIRMVSEEAFPNDPIRMVRAYRMGAMLDFDIDPSTADAVERHAFRIKDAAGERIWPELLKILTTASSLGQIRQMLETGLLFEIFPEMKGLRGCAQNRYHAFDVLDHTLHAFFHLESMIHRRAGIPEDIFDRIHDPLLENKGPLLKLTMLLHDIGKPAARTTGIRGDIHFYGHEKRGAALFNGVAERLKLSNFESGFTHNMIRHHLRPLHLFNARQSGTLSQGAITRFFMRLQTNAPLLLLHALADKRGKKETDGDSGDDPYQIFILERMRDYFFRFQPRAENKPLITGHDIRREFGIRPSPLFGRILQRVEEERLSDESFERQDALRLAEEIIQENEGQENEGGKSTKK